MLLRAGFRTGVLGFPATFFWRLQVAQLDLLRARKLNQIGAMDGNLRADRRAVNNRAL